MLSEDRIRELEAEAESRSEEDEALLHTLGLHVGEATQQLIIALAEFHEYAQNDERHKRGAEVVTEILARIQKEANGLLDSIPGVLTQDEILVLADSSQFGQKKEPMH